MAKILVMTDMDFTGSGYYYLMTPILQGLAARGHQIKVVGIGYFGAEHYYDFTIVPCRELREGASIAMNIIKLWKPDVFVGGLDIPMQEKLYETLQPLGIKYVAITPLENPPLTQSWAATLMKFGYTFFISKLGAEAAKKAGVDNCDYLTVGIDSESFYPPTVEERIAIRDSMGYGDNEFVVLTVADNQERKNLSASMKAMSLAMHPDISPTEFDLIMAGRSDKRVSDFPKRGKFKYVMVTRENSIVGHRLRDLAVTMDINKEFIIYERGMSQKELRKLYVSSDLFLLLSKAEGLGIPILEAMACKCPVMATDTGAIHELLEGGRGILVPEAYGMTDVWGNSWRSFADAVFAGSVIYTQSTKYSGLGSWDTDGMSNRAYEFVMSRKVEDDVEKAETKIMEIINA